MTENSITVRGLSLGDGRTKICIPVTAHTTAGLFTQIRKIQAAPCEIVEMRADYFEGDPMEELRCLRKEMPDMPILFTLRSKEEGGARGISDGTYEKICAQAAESGQIDLIDLEWNRGEEMLRKLMQKAHGNNVPAVVSYHDFSGTPGKDALLDLLERMQNSGADITKAAVMPQTERDVVTLLDTAVAMKETCADRPYILLSMGELGKVSRLCGTLTGSALTFASAGASSAPGQMDAEFVRACRDAF